MKRINISQVDALFSHGGYPIEFLFFYADGFSTKRLRRALHDLSSIFWPIFGTYREGSIFFEPYREDQIFDEEAVNRGFDRTESAATDAEAVSRYRLKEMKRLFFLKVKRFKNGTALIPKMQHVAGDGYSYFTFLSALAALSRPPRIPFKSSVIKSLFRPHHRRTVLKDFQFRGMELAPAALNERRGIECDVVSRRDVRALIEEAASSPALRLSTNDILTAKVIKKLVGIQPERWRNEINLTIPIDVRRRVDEYGRRFFGNGILLHTIEFKQEQIRGPSLLETAIQIRKSMPSITTENYTGYLEHLERMIAAGDSDRFQPFDPEKGCLVTNLSRLPVSRLDFGAGIPASIIPLTIEKNSTAILAEKENFILWIVT